MEEYYQELKLSMLWVKIEKDPEASMARFLGGLRQDITHIVELKEYEDLRDIYHKVLKAERQLKKKGEIWSNTSTTS